MFVKKGIDISYHQGNIDFNKVKESGIDFVIIREGYRLTTDKKFFEYVEKAKAAGLQILGVYHFSYALNVVQASDEAAYCVKRVQEAGLPDNTMIFFDFEYDTVAKAAKQGVTLGKIECNLHTDVFCEEARAWGYPVGVYTNLDYHKNWYNQNILSKYPIWLADYTGGPDFDCIIQQYTSKGSVPGISGNVDLNYLFEDIDFKMNEASTLRSRKAVVDLVNSWIGKNEKDGSYKGIIDIYNSYSGPLPRGVKMQYDWAWCAATWSALAIKLGYTDIMPIEISCGELIKQAQNMGIWQESDDYIPKPGDALLYDWDDNGVGDNTGWPDHVGTVTYVNEESGYMVITEGNYSDSVKKRTISINGKYIRGFITPKYDLDDCYSAEESVDNGQAVGKSVDEIAHEVIAGIWDKGEKRKELLEKNGYDYYEIQARVNEILNNPTTTNKPTSTGTVTATCAAKSFSKGFSGTYITTVDLYCRNDAGSNKKALCIIPKGTKVSNYGYYTMSNKVMWLYIQFTLNGIKYTGFSSGNYLIKG